MADLNQAGQDSLPPSNEKEEIQRLSLLVSDLQTECERLRQALAQTTKERDAYLKAIYAYERAKLDIEDLDIGDLEKISAGPVELIR